MNKSLTAVILPLLLIILTQASCNETSSLIKGPDDKITEQDALAQNYSLTTPFFGIQVSIDENVEKDNTYILNLLDSRIKDFLDCQFFEEHKVGFKDFKLEDGTIVPPLNKLRIYVVPYTFECDAADKNTCGGIYFSSSDIIVVAEQSIGRCEELPLIKHEVAHRYGLKADHSNQEEFSFCSDPENCDIGDIFDITFKE